MFKIGHPKKKKSITSKKIYKIKQIRENKNSEQNSSNQQINSFSETDMESQTNITQQQENNSSNSNNNSDTDNFNDNNNNEIESKENQNKGTHNRRQSRRQSSLLPGSHGFPHKTQIVLEDSQLIEEGDEIKQDNSEKNLNNNQNSIKQIEQNSKDEEQKQDTQLINPKKKVKGITVYARIRPLAVGVDEDKEFGYNFNKMIEIKNKKEILLKESNTVSRKFKFDRVFDDQTTQEEMFRDTTEFLVDKLFQGFNCAILVYGQSGSGKTHTMLGEGYDNAVNIANNKKEKQGLVPRFMDSMFYRIYSEENNNITYDIRASYIEIYNEQIRDLLFPQNNNLNIYTEPNSGLLISSATQVPITCSKDVLNLIENGSKIRKIAKTNYNEHSSRSHAIVIITIFIDDMKTGVKKAAQLYMTDLAGSENVGRAQGNTYTDVQVKEAGKINQSLLTLGNVIASLIDKSKHIPYRNSKLTRLLQNAFGGSSYTSLILNISQNPENYYQTLGTLQFGDRANKVENTPNCNVEMGEKQLRKMYDKVCQQLIQQNEHLKMQKIKINKQQFLMKQMFQLIDPMSQQMLMNQFSQDLNFLIPPEQRTQHQQVGILKLYGNCFGYLFTFLHPIDIVPMFTVCKAFNNRLKSEYLWKCQLDNIKKNNKEFEYDQQNIKSYYQFFKNVSLSLYWKKKKNQIQSKHQANLQLFSKK